MTKEIRKTTQFKKDFKRISKDIKKVEAEFRIRPLYLLSLLS